MSAEINGGSEVLDPRYVGGGLAVGPGYFISGESGGLEDLAIVSGCTISEAIGLVELIIVPGYTISEVEGLEGC